MEIFQLSSSDLPYIPTQYHNRIINDYDLVWRGKRLRECYLPEPIIAQDIGREVGVIEEGRSYPFDGNEVRHVKFDGAILPDGLCRLFGKLAMSDGTILIDPSDYIYTDIVYGGNYYGIRFCHTFCTRTYEIQPGLQVTWWLYDSNLAWPSSSSGYDYRVDYHGMVYDVSTSRCRVLSDWERVHIPQYDKKINPTTWAESWSARLLLAFENFFSKAKQRTYSANTVPTWRHFMFEGSNSVDLTYQYHTFQRIAHRYIRKYPWSDVETFGEGELARQCVQGQHSFDGNLLNWADKLTGWGGGIESILKLVDNPSDKKAWASAWLSNRFGDRLEYNTSIDLLDAVWDKLLTIPIPSKYSGYNVSRASLQASYGGGQLTRRMRLVCSNDSVSKLMTAVKKFMDWDAWPSLENTFDLIPLSFVVDWFTNLSVILDNVDQMVYRQYLKCELCENTVKVEIPAQFRTDRIGTLYHFEGKVILYSRKGSTIIPEFGILEGWDPRLPSLVNIVDGASLLCQFMT